MGFGFFKERASCSALAWMIQDGNFPMEKTGPFGGKGQKYVAIARPRRFGKTVMANMAAAYFGRGSNPADERRRGKGNPRAEISDAADMGRNRRTYGIWAHYCDKKTWRRTN